MDQQRVEEIILEYAAKKGMTGILQEILERRGMESFQVLFLAPLRLFLAVVLVIVEKDDVVVFRRVINILKMVNKKVNTGPGKHLPLSRFTKLITELKRRIVLDKMRRKETAEDAYALIDKYFPHLKLDSIVAHNDKNTRRGRIRFREVRQQLLEVVDKNKFIHHVVPAREKKDLVKQVKHYIREVNDDLPPTKIEQLSSPNGSHYELHNSFNTGLPGSNRIYRKLVLLCMDGHPSEKDLRHLLRDVWDDESPREKKRRRNRERGDDLEERKSVAEKMKNHEQEALLDQSVGQQSNDLASDVAIEEREIENSRQEADTLYLKIVREVMESDDEFENNQADSSRYLKQTWRESTDNNRDRNQSSRQSPDVSRDRSRRPSHDVSRDQSRRPSPDVSRYQFRRQSPDVSRDQSGRQSPDVSRDQSRRRSPDVSRDQSRRQSPYVSRDQSRRQSPDVSRDQSTRQSPDVCRDQSRRQSPDINRDQSRRQSPYVSRDQSRRQSPDVSRDQSTRQSPDVCRDQSRRQSPDINRDQSRRQSTDVSRDQSRRPSPNVSIDQSRGQSPDVSRDQSRRQSPDVSRDQSRRQSPDVSRDQSRRQSPDVSRDQPRRQSLGVSRDRSSRQSPDVSREKFRRQSPDISRDQSRRQSPDVSRDEPRRQSLGVSRDHSRRQSRDVSKHPNQSKRKSPDVSRDQSRRQSPDVSRDQSRRQSPDVSRDQSRRQSPYISRDQSRIQSPDVSRDQPRRQSLGVSRDRSSRQSPDVSREKFRRQSTYVSRDQSRRQSPDVSRDQSRRQSPDISRDQSRRQSPDVSRDEPRRQSLGVSRDHSRRQSPDVSRHPNESKRQSPDVSRDQSRRQSPDICRDQSRRHSPDVSRNQSRKQSPGVSRDHSRRQSPNVSRDLNRNKEFDGDHEVPMDTEPDGSDFVLTRDVDMTNEQIETSSPLTESTSPSRVFPISKCSVFLKDLYNKHNEIQSEQSYKFRRSLPMHSTRSSKRLLYMPRGSSDHKKAEKRIEEIQSVQSSYKFRRSLPMHSTRSSKRLLYIPSGFSDHKKAGKRCEEARKKGAALGRERRSSSNTSATEKRNVPLPEGSPVLKKSKSNRKRKSSSSSSGLSKRALHLSKSSFRIKPKPKRKHWSRRRRRLVISSNGGSPSVSRRKIPSREQEALPKERPTCTPSPFPGDNAEEREVSFPRFIAVLGLTPKKSNEALSEQKQRSEALTENNLAQRKVHLPTCFINLRKCDEHWSRRRRRLVISSNGGSPSVSRRKIPSREQEALPKERPTCTPSPFPGDNAEEREVSFPRFIAVLGLTPKKSTEALSEQKQRSEALTENNLAQRKVHLPTCFINLKKCDETVEQGAVAKQDPAPSTGANSDHEMVDQSSPLLFEDSETPYEQAVIELKRRSLPLSRRNLAQREVYLPRCSVHLRKYKEPTVTHSRRLVVRSTGGPSIFKRKQFVRRSIHIPGCGRVRLRQSLPAIGIYM